MSGEISFSTFGSSKSKLSSSLVIQSCILIENQNYLRISLFNLVTFHLDYSPKLELNILALVIVLMLEAVLLFKMAINSVISFFFWKVILWFLYVPFFNFHYGLVIVRASMLSCLHIIFSCYFRWSWNVLVSNMSRFFKDYYFQ